MKKKRFLVISIILYVLAILSLAYTIWAIIGCHDYISSLISSGSLETSGNTYNIVNYYMSNSAPYGVYTIIFAVLGYFIYAIPNANATVKKESISEISYEESNNDSTDELAEEVTENEEK